MGRSMIGGLIAGGTHPDAIRVGEAYEPSRSAIEREFGVVTNPDNIPVVAGADVVVLAVKPQDAASALPPLRQQLAEKRPLVISVAAGIRTSDLESWCGEGVPVVRCMPNRPALVRAGATALFASEQVNAQQRTIAESVMRAVGAVVWVEKEDTLDVVTAFSGSGPAYFYLFAELMTEAAVDLGLEPAAARVLAIETLYGAGHLAREEASRGGSDLARLRQEVTSKGGTTEAALRVFAAADLRSVVKQALVAATQRGRELAAQFGAQR